jgi:hypothetical protein
MASVLDGFACLYNIEHSYKGRREIFAPNCFAGSIHDGTMFFIDHKISTKKLGDVDDGNLELFDSPVGLAFRLKLAAGDLARLDGRSEVSVSYIERDVELRNGVRNIKSAILFECSACHIATMRGTHCIVRDARTVGTLAHDSKNSFASDGAATKFMDALRRLQ